MTQACLHSSQSWYFDRSRQEMFCEDCKNHIKPTGPSRIWYTFELRPPPPPGEPHEALHLPLEATDDHELTCMKCNGEGCDLEFSMKGNGQTIVVGLHRRCISPKHVVPI